MANTEPQLPLIDIQEPALNTFWPLAPGWWFMLLLAVLLSGYLFRFVWLKRQKAAALRQAKAELKQLDPTQTAALNELLKRLIRYYRPGHPILTASGTAWQNFLQQQMPEQPLPDLQKLLYQAQAESGQAQHYFSFAHRWLNQLTVKQLERL